jgi:carboxypeptidase Q
MKKFVVSLVAVCLLLSTQALVNAQSLPFFDAQTVENIKKEGLDNSHLMEYASWLTDVYGPRLTNTPNLMRAQQYTMKVFEEIGLEEIHLHKWGPFGTGWELKRFAFHASSPYAYFPVIAYPKAWSPGYDGLQVGEAVYLNIQTPADYDRYRGTLAGKFVLIEEPVRAEPSWNPLGTRRDSDNLLQLANATRIPPRPGGGGANAAALARAQAAFERAQFLMDESPLAILDQSYRGWGGQVAISGATLPADPNLGWAQRPRPHQIDAPTPVPQISLAREHYGRIFRLLEKDIPVTIELEMEVEFQKEDLYGYNLIAEIKGTDPVVGDEIVMLGAHIDSWHTGTGATDNASGTAVMMEALRILKALGVQPRRTIRVGLWSGEEQGLHGSREYVEEFFGRLNDDGELVKGPYFEKLSAYYNIDNGSGQVRGIYLQGNEAVREHFRTWLLPFAEWDANTVTFSNTGGTDHLSYDRVGLPGFQFIQDPLEYFTFTHHSNMDTYERLVEQDLVRTAIIVATFVYHTAMMDQRMPRKE